MEAQSALNEDSLYAAIELMEGMPEIRFPQCPWGNGEMSLLAALDRFQTRVNEVKALSPEERAWQMESWSTVIYGCGGWHRYYLRLDGKVYFSKRHSNNQGIADATALGFNLWEERL